MKKYIQNILKFYYNISPVSIHILAIGMEISAVFFIASILLEFFASSFTYVMRIHELASSCSTAGVALIYACLFISCIVDIIVKNTDKELQNDDQKKQK